MTPGRAQFALLSAIPEPSCAVTACERALQGTGTRKFGESEVASHAGFGRVATCRAANREEDAAEQDDRRPVATAQSAKYHSDLTGFATTSTMESRAGRWQLAQVLEKKGARGRAGQIRAPQSEVPGADANPVYLEQDTFAALKSALQPQANLKLQVCRKAFGESRRALRSVHCRRPREHRGPVLPNDAIEMLHWLATEHEDPATEALARRTLVEARRTTTAKFDTERNQHDARQSRHRHFGISSSTMPLTSSGFVRLLMEWSATRARPCSHASPARLRAVAYRAPTLGMSRLFLVHEPVRGSSARRPTTMSYDFIRDRLQRQLRGIKSQSWSGCSGSSEPDSLRGGCAVGEPRAPGGPKCFGSCG